MSKPFAERRLFYTNTMPVRAATPTMLAMSCGTNSWSDGDFQRVGDMLHHIANILERDVEKEKHKPVPNTGSWGSQPTCGSGGGQPK